MTQDSLLLTLMDNGLAQCHGAVADHGGLLVSLFVAGLVGSASHCVGMCGPFVLSQTVARLEAVPAARMTEFHRLAGAALVPYHLGRATTYAMLGAAAALVAGGAVQLGGLKSLSAALLALAALFFLGYAVRKLAAFLPFAAGPGSGNGTGTGSGEGWWSRSIGRLARPLFARPLGWRGYGLGVALGFIPCGLLYGALAAAASSGDALGGAFGMLAFSAGTVPSLIAVGIAGHLAGRRWQGAVARIAPVLLAVNAAALGYMAWQLAA